MYAFFSQPSAVCVFLSATVVTDRRITLYAVDNGLDLKLGEKKKKKKKKPAVEVGTRQMHCI